MTETLLYREAFTGEIRTVTDDQGTPINEITTTDGWTPFWREDNGHVRPEMKVIDASTTDYIEPVMRLNDEGRGLKIFKQWGIIDGGYWKQFVVPAGFDEVHAYLQGHAWYSQVNFPVASLYKAEDGTLHPCDEGMRLWVGIDPAGGKDPWAESVHWQSDCIFDEHRRTGTLRRDHGGIITVFIRTDNDYGFLHVDGYLAAVEVYGFSEDPPATECPQPREGWTERTTVLVRADAPDSVWLDACAWANDPTRRHDVSKSWDHAVYGPELKVNVILWMDNPDAFNGLIVAAWFQEYYSDIDYWISEHIAYDVPPVEPPPDEPQYWLRSDNLIGLHSGFTRAMSQPYILESGTCIQKFFSAGDAYHAAKDAPGIVSVWRKYVGNEQGRIWEQPTIRLSALWYLDQYTAEIETARTNMGLTLDQFLEREISIESLNETIPTYNQPVLEDAVAFDVHFCDLAHERYGDSLSTVLLCGAIGNPHESEVPLLLPAAEIAAKWMDFIGYHPYFTDNEHDNDPLFINQHWPYHAGRWMEWDTYFRSQGVYPRYAGGEGGTVYAWDGVSFDSGKGWKACGSMEKYLQNIAIYNERVLEWNKIHGNRCAGLTLFGYGNWGWDNFELGDGDVGMLLNWATGTPASYSEMLAFALERSKETSADLYLESATYISDDWRKQIESREPIKRGIW